MSGGSSDHVASYTPLRRERYGSSPRSKESGPKTTTCRHYNMSNFNLPRPQEVKQHISWGWADALVIIPTTKKDGTHWVEWWDVLVVFVLVEQMYHVPLDLALRIDEAWWNLLFQLFLVLIFTLDLVLQFFIAYLNNPSDLTVELWETDFRMIAKRYCGVPFSYRGRGGWFWIDFFSMVPGWIFVTAWYAACLRPLERYARCLTILRIPRLVMKFRMKRWARFLTRVHSTAAFPYYIYDLVLLVIVTTCACHWFACFWLVLEGKITKGDISYDDTKSWLSVMIDQKGDPCFPNAKEDPFCTYVLALYWSAVSVTSIGFGDIVPQNRLEYFAAGAFLLMGGYVWAYVVGAVVSVLSNLDPRGDDFKRSVDDLNDLMYEKGVPWTLQVRLREYMHEADSIKREEEQIQFLESTISEGLQREVVHTTKNMQLLGGIYWTNDLCDDVRLELVKAFRPRYDPKHEVIMNKQMIFVIFSGMALWKCRVLKRGNTWGHENILLTSDSLIDRAQLLTITAVSAMSMKKESLMWIADQFPDLKQRLRKAQIKAALYRALVLTAATRRKGIVASPDNVQPIWQGTPLRVSNESRSHMLRSHVNRRVDSLEKRIQGVTDRILHELDDMKLMLKQKNTKTITGNR